MSSFCLKFISTALLGGVALLLLSCQDHEKPKKTTPLTKGKTLAFTHCSRCHLTPSPADLPMDRWEFVLTWMGHYLGMENEKGDEYTSLLTPENVIATPIMDEADWQMIRDYFLSGAREEPTPEKSYPMLAMPSGIFAAGERFSSLDHGRIVSAFHIREGKSGPEVLIADAVKKEIIICDTEGYFLDHLGPFETETSDFFEVNGQVGLVQIGHLFLRENHGRLRLVGENHRENPIIIKDLPRTAHARTTKAIGTHPERLLLSCFGDGNPGDLRIVYPDGSGVDVIREARGCVEARPIDLDQDGDEDILALFAHGHQRMWAFFNDGTGNYSEQKILWERPPGQGYTGFQIADFDQDGRTDIATFAGNNLELPDAPIRPHHGIHFFRGLPDQEFQEIAFIPLPGAIGMEIGDFNLDGKPDFAAVANFVDWRTQHPPGAVLCLQHDPFRFSMERLPVAAQAPYFSLKITDLDADGDPDLLLGGFPYMPRGVPPLEKKQAQQTINQQWSVTLLRNLTR